MEHYDIFISYKRNDREKVFAIKDYIEKNVGVNCWIDLDDIESDAQFANVIIKAIKDAQVFLFMYSASHTEIEDVDNDWTVREITFAQKRKKRIVFINIDGTPLTDWFDLMFGNKQQVDATSESAKNKLCKDLKEWLKIEDLEIKSKVVAKPSDSIISVLSQSNTFPKDSFTSTIFPAGILLASSIIKNKFEKHSKKKDHLFSILRNQKTREYEWYQVIRNCTKDGQMVVLESDMIVDTLDLEKLFDALMDKDVSEIVLKQVGTCRTIGDLMKLLVDKVDK